MVTRQDLDLDVSSPDHPPFEHQAGIAKGGLGLTGGGRQGFVEVRSAFDGAHPLATAPGGGLDQQGETELGGVAMDRLAVEVGEGQTLEHRNPHPVGDRLGLALVPHATDRLGGRSDEDQTLGPAALREVGVLRQKAVARMNRAGPGGVGGGDHRVEVEVGLGRGRGS